MQPGVRVFPVHGRSLIYIYMERERLNFVVKAVGICEQCILWGEQNFIFWGIASLWSEFLLNFSNFEEIELSKYTWKKAHRIMVRLPSPKENGWSKLPSKSNFCACWPACVCYTISVMSSSLRPYGLWPTRLLCLWDSPGKNTWVGRHAHLQGIFWTQGSKSYLLCLLHWQAGSLPLAPPEKPNISRASLSWRFYDLMHKVRKSFLHMTFLKFLWLKIFSMSRCRNLGWHVLNPITWSSVKAFVIYLMI